MNIVIDALPINHMSGRHVISGHLRMLAKYHGDRHQFFVLHHHNNRDLCCDLGSSFHWIECPNFGENWPARLWWQFTQLESLLTQLKAQLIISTSGALVPGTKLPQVVIAQNPWCYVREFHYTIGDRLKAWLQRQGYKQAQKKAQAMFYLSEYVARLYENDAGVKPQAGKILYVGIDEETYQVAQSQYLTFEQRPLEILTVSAMTPHKAIEDVVKVFSRLHELNTRVHLTLVGPWSTDDYRSKIETLIQALNLSNFVTITGKVSVSQLREHYRRARAFCLLSRSESFGIPAVEAQAFGTPTIVADVCAPPEVAGPGGIVIDPQQIREQIPLIQSLLTDRETWSCYSTMALENTERFRWQKVSKPLISYF
ncbi:glycosyltransferase [Sphaerospermopsis kisseleviana CS-549]|uniref:Glycosyltransferase n=1 Tax=Sphaerospermopsis kisseleviana CS-549 TaxID=3021783 RepID=A0ABT4ZUG7_9CYAN|nr:glycosyltransferase [Sphaerospermopsis kisseleviana]MDB9442924.1 glycosyltransferase [Sphaerospermopsis kisseleviana CS-549]BAZ82416.1 group 1 glycosyl transferase [Sphaerospermopsis kisseleviana NIES-73]